MNREKDRSNVVIPPRSNFEKKELDQARKAINRRHFGELAIGAAVASVFLYLMINGAQDTKESVEKVIKESVDTHNLNGKKIEDEPVEFFVFDSYSPIILRNSTDQGDNIKGYTKSDPETVYPAQAEYGTPYESGVPGLGKFVKDGKAYGKWFQIVGVPLYDEVAGNFVPRLDENGVQIKSGTVHVSGNFLTKASDEQIANLSNAR